MARCGKRVCCALLDALRIAGVQGVSVGCFKGGLLVMLSNVERDSSKVPAEFYGFKTDIRQDADFSPPLMHRKVGAGCAHSRWELKQFMGKGIVPNTGCQEAASTEGA
jgi:hypothetical protein